MHINRKNYENVFLSYLENGLQPGEVADLLIFLEQNPDLRTELEGIENISLNPYNNVAFSNKNALKKREYISTQNINPWNYEEKMVAMLEGDLSDSGIKELKQFMRLNPHSNLELNLFKKAVLTPENITYPDKNQLKKGSVVVPLFTRLMYASSVAAVFILLFGLYFLVSRQNTSSTMQLEEIADTPPQKEQSHVTALPEEVAEVSETIGRPPFNALEKKSEVPEFYKAEPINTIAMRLWEKNLATVPVSGPIAFRNQISDQNLFDLTRYEDESGPSFAGRFIRGLASKVIGQPDFKNRSLVEMTVDGYNLLADREVEIDKKYDEQGNVIAYNIRGESISFNRNISKSQKNP
jgi:hypothetical protein